MRLDTGRFLNEADLRDGGQGAIVFVWDAVSGAPAPAPGCTGNGEQPKLDMGDIEPPIVGRFSVTLADGTQAAVVPVGSLLREHLEPWTFETAAEVTGLAVEQVEHFAEGFARAKRPMVLSSWGSNRFLHSDQMNRAKILCLSLKGAVGRKGSGDHPTGWIETGGLGIREHTGMRGRLALFMNMDAGTLFDLAVERVCGRISAQLMTWELAGEMGEDFACLTNAASLNLAYQGVAEDLDREQAGLYPRPLTEYDREAREKSWMPRFPSKQARAWVTGGNNVLRRSNLPQRSLEQLWPELDLVVDVNPKFTFTGMHADYLLPAAGYYEKRGIKYAVAYIPDLHYCDAAVPPLGESKDEWEIFWRLAQEVQRVARERGTPIMPGCGKIDPISPRSATAPRSTGSSAPTRPRR